MTCLIIYSITINKEVVRHTAKARYLGVHFDSDLNWNAHVDCVVAKTAKKICILRLHGKIYHLRLNESSSRLSSTLTFTIVHQSGPIPQPPLVVDCS